MAILYSSKPTRRYRLDGNGTPQGVLDELKTLIEDGSIIPDDFYCAHLKYYSSSSLANYDGPRYYPLKFFAKDKELWLACIKIGVKDESSKAILKALSVMGFHVGIRQKQDILSYKNLNITYRKPKSRQP